MYTSVTPLRKLELLTSSHGNLPFLGADCILFNADHVINITITGLRLLMQANVMISKLTEGGSGVIGGPQKTSVHFGSSDSFKIM